MYPVNEPETIEDIEWEIIDSERGRVVIVTAKKKVVAQGVTIWWPHVFRKHRKEDEFDVTNVKGRNSETENVWKKAHEEFRRKMKAQQEC